MPIAEFDYSPDMDESIHIYPVRVTQPTSLACSRINTNISSHRKVLMDLEHYIQQYKNNEQ